MYRLRQPAQHQLGKCIASALHAFCYGLLSVACIAASMGAWLTETSCCLICYWSMACSLIGAKLQACKRNFAKLITNKCVVIQLPSSC